MSALSRPQSCPPFDCEVSGDGRPRVVGFLRNDVARLEASRHIVAMRRHADMLGYRYVYTVCPPDHLDDPIGYLLDVVCGTTVAAVVVFDLEAVDHSPARVCEICDLETVCPPQTWARVCMNDARAHAFPDHTLSVDEAVRIMQQHRGCSALECARKSNALTRLVAAGKMTPPAVTAADRVNERGIMLSDSGIAAAPLHPRLRRQAHGR